MRRPQFSEQLSERFPELLQTHSKDFHSHLHSLRTLEKAVAVRNSLLEKFSGKFRRCWKILHRFSGSTQCHPCQGLGIFREREWLLENWPCLRERCWIFSSETATALLSSPDSRSIFSRIGVVPVRQNKTLSDHPVTDLLARVTGQTKNYVPWFPRIAHKSLTPTQPTGRLPPHWFGRRPKMRWFWGGRVLRRVLLKKRACHRVCSQQGFSEGVRRRGFPEGL